MQAHRSGVDELSHVSRCSATNGCWCRLALLHPSFPHRCSDLGLAAAGILASMRDTTDSVDGCLNYSRQESSAARLADVTARNPLPAHSTPLHVSSAPRNGGWRACLSIPRHHRGQRRQRPTPPCWRFSASCDGRRTPPAVEPRTESCCLCTCDPAMPSPGSECGVVTLPALTNAGHLGSVPAQLFVTSKQCHLFDLEAGGDA